VLASKMLLKIDLSLPKTRSELVMTVHVDHISDLAAVV